MADLFIKSIQLSSACKRESYAIMTESNPWRPGHAPPENSYSLSFSSKLPSNLTKLPLSPSVIFLNERYFSQWWRNVSHAAVSSSEKCCFTKSLAFGKTSLMNFEPHENKGTSLIAEMNAATI
eukprot:21010_3